MTCKLTPNLVKEIYDLIDTKELKNSLGLKCSMLQSDNATLFGRDISFPSMMSIEEFKNTYARQ